MKFRVLRDLALVVLLGVIALFFYGSLLWGFFGDWALSGVFGDSFGALNALFSGCAFLGIVYTILLQREDLYLTREELRRSVLAQERSEKALQAQAKNQELVARLSSMSTLIQVYLNRIATYPEAQSSFEGDIIEWTTEINKILESLEGSSDSMGEGLTV